MELNDMIIRPKADCNDYSWLFAYLDIQLGEGQELSSDADEALFCIMSDLTEWDDEDLCYYWKYMEDDEIAEVIDRHATKLWYESGDVRLKTWRVQITDKVGNQGCTNWLEFDNRIDADFKFEELDRGIEILSGQRFELVEVDYVDGDPYITMIEHS